LVLAAVAAVGCGRTKPVETAPPPPPPPTSWFPADNASAADALAAEVLRRPWINEFRDRTARVPALFIGTFNDRTDREVDVAALTASLGKAIGASSAVRVVDDAAMADFRLTGTLAFQEADAGTVRYYQFDLRVIDVKGEPVGAPISLERRKSN
jgi:hypothetical protein